MTLQHISSAPPAEDFTPLEEHQEQTPTSFFSSKPVLYAHYSGLTLMSPATQMAQDGAFSKFAASAEGEDVLINNITIWVSSQNLVLFQTSPAPTGVTIPYPSIALHATMKYKTTIEALYMNIALNDTDSVNDEQDIHTLELTVLPPSYTENATNTCITDIFNAMNSCADLHPDPNGSDDDGDDDEDSAPGASGWITAENMDQYMDEEGNFGGLVVGDALGPGAGTVRVRDEGADGHGEKYYRTG
ncbi:hypothetical protein BDW02DRAFT_638186 [Decorospora gaudefroyi]|uniref:Benzoylformate decarboxylase n=1 Tax=Decorospora gaudefroyi TaxID=184978 RepID=A0A6A5KJ20_9PLEO|nr:hypothetical protein BDW02DRAFT_638186 [Decorospora gaudefroyi]